MNILIPNSWLSDYLETNATPQQFADAMSLTSVSIERIEKVGDDFVYDIEVTTNRPDLMSIVGIAREASAVLPQQGFTAKFKPHTVDHTPTTSKSDMLTISSDPTLINRIMAVVLEIDLHASPEYISDRLTKTGIRSINNAVDVTNYIMREIGHPSHVFDYDRLNDHTLNIRRSKKGEKITTLDGKEYTLPGNDIVADDGNGTIIDLLGIIGTANSVVVDTTKRIVLFLDNNNHNLLRKTSMNLGIRTEAAVLNEKGVNPDIMLPTLVTGIELLKKHANAKVISPIIDIYPNRIKSKTIKVTKDKIDSVIGIEIPQKTVVDILESLGFGVTVKENEFTVEIFTSRVNDIDIPEDIIEEVARVYGYHKIPNSLPSLTEQANYHQEQNEFYWIQKVKEAFKFWGFTEVYTYSLVTEELFDGPIENALKLKNPLTEDKTYLRNSLVPSVIDVANQSKSNNLQLFEIANVYLKKNKGLPDEVLHLAVVVRKEKASFFDGKGIVESVAKILGITTISFEKKKDGIEGADIMLSGKNIGSIEADEDITVEINVQELLKHANSKKIYKEPAKFPPLIEDVRVEIPAHYPFAKIEKALKESSELVHSISLLDVYKNKKTFRIVYLSRTRSLTTGDIQPIRKGIEDILTTQFKATLG
jgi:phenylalanyl-tRNA synthetase beta chain